MLQRIANKAEFLSSLTKLVGWEPLTFLGQLKTAWDEHFSRNPNLVLILSGSQSTWIDDNILGDMNFVGRVAYPLTLQELSLQECSQFWGVQKRSSFTLRNT